MANARTVYISLGGNMGNEAARFAEAFALLNAIPGINVIKVSGLYLTEPQGDSDQPWFSNQVAAIQCCDEMTAADFLRLLLDIESKLGRTRCSDRRYGPRSIDLDLLLFGDIITAEENVRVPHPRMSERAFVLVPLLEIAPLVRFPDGTFLEACLKKLCYTVSGNIIRQDHRGNYGKSK